MTIVISNECEKSLCILFYFHTQKRFKSVTSNTMTMTMTSIIRHVEQSETSKKINPWILRPAQDDINLY